MRLSLSRFPFSILIRITLAALLCVSLLLYIRHLKTQFHSTRLQTILNTTRPNFTPLMKHLFTQSTLDDVDLITPYITYFKTAAQYDSDDDTVHNLLAYLYALNNQTDPMNHHSTQAYELNPDSLITQYNYAVTLFKQQHYNKALNILKNGLDRTPQDEIRHLQSSMVYRQLIPAPRLWQQVARGLVQLQQQRQALMILCAKHLSTSSQQVDTNISLSPRVF